MNQIQFTPLYTTKNRNFPRRSRFYMLRQFLVPILIIVTIVVGGIIFMFSNLLKNRENRQASESQQQVVSKYKEVKESAKPTPDFSSWRVYHNQNSGFSMSIPTEWLIDELRDKNNNSLGAVSFTPSEKGEQYGSVNKITIIYKPDTDPNPATLSSQKVFDTWYEHEEYQENDLVKLDNQQIANQKGIIYANSKVTESGGYSLTGWTRKDNNNYYVIVEGNKQLEEVDIHAFKNLLFTIAIQPKEERN